MMSMNMFTGNDQICGWNFDCPKLEEVQFVTLEINYITVAVKVKLNDIIFSVNYNIRFFSPFYLVSSKS